MKKTSGTIPIRVSVTGHRMLNADGLASLYDSVRNILTYIRLKAPDSEIVLAANMAEGADQICCRIAKELSVPYLAVLPFDREEYEKDFEGEALTAFESICGGAEQTFSVCAAGEASEDRDACYRKAGDYLADHCHVLLCLSNGDAAKPGGCGAAEIAAYAEGNGIPVMYINAPRAGENPEHAGEVRLFYREERFEEMLRQTDEYNRNCKKLDIESGTEPLPEEDICIRALSDVYRAADAFSCSFSKRFVNVLRLIAVLGSVFTLAFLLYDELNAHYLIFCCGLFLLVSVLALKMAEKTKLHKNYLSCRVLAECMRVQKMLSYAGSSLEVPKILLWTQKYEYPWISAAVSSLLMGKGKTEPHDIRTCWLREQRDYHREVQKNDTKIRRASRILKTALILSIATYLFAFCLELFLCRMLSAETAETIRTVVKIAVGTFSAATLFTANYYGKLSLGRKRDDSGKMAEFFDIALKEAGENAPDEEFLLKIAREELSENGSWYSYMKDNAPDIGI